MGRKCPGLGAGWAKPTLNWVESGYELLSISCVTLNLLLQSQPICFCRYIRVICSCLQLFGEGAVISTVLLPPLAKAKSVLLNRDFQTISRFSLVFEGIKTKTMKQETYINFTRWYNFSVINQSQIVLFLHFYFIQRTLIFHKKDSLKIGITLINFQIEFHWDKMGRVFFSLFPPQSSLQTLARIEMTSKWSSSYFFSLW